MREEGGVLMREESGVLMREEGRVLMKEEGGVLMREEYLSTAHKYLHVVPMYSNILSLRDDISLRNI